MNYICRGCLDRARRSWPTRLPVCSVRGEEYLLEEWQGFVTTEPRCVLCGEKIEETETAGKVTPSGREATVELLIAFYMTSEKAYYWGYLWWSPNKKLSREDLKMLGDWLDDSQMRVYSVLSEE